MNNLKKHVFKIMGIFIMSILAMCGTVYGRYVIDKSSTVKISSAPFYLEATIDSNIVCSMDIITIGRQCKNRR